MERLYYDIIGTVCVPVVIPHAADHYDLLNELSDFFIEIDEEEAKEWEEILAHIFRPENLRF
jgi:hypothetical protein